MLVKLSQSYCLLCKLGVPPLGQDGGDRAPVLPAPTPAAKPKAKAKQQAKSLPKLKATPKGASKAKAKAKAKATAEEGPADVEQSIVEQSMEAEHADETTAKPEPKRKSALRKPATATAIPEPTGPTAMKRPAAAAPPDATPPKKAPKKRQPQRVAPEWTCTPRLLVLWGKAVSDASCFSTCYLCCFEFDGWSRPNLVASHPLPGKNCQFIEFLVHEHRCVGTSSLPVPFAWQPVHQTIPGT